MSLSSKIDLENAIFARAAHLHTSVYSKYGGLVSPAEDLELQTLIYVYNVNFRTENFKNFCSPQEGLEPCQNYLSQRTGKPGLTRIYSARELNFELILSEEK